MNTTTTVTTTGHHRMLGAAVVSHLPVLRRGPFALEHAEHGLFLLWLAFMGLLGFGALLLWQAGAWHRLVQADPTGLTIAIVLLFTGCSLWAGRRAWVLGQQRLRLDAAREDSVDTWSAEYRAACARPGADPTICLQVLGERAHGPHEMAWWLNGIQLKLGLLGKVIGFSILALQLGEVQSFDASQSTQLLKNLTGGLGIALLTTVTGLTGNILLGLQLMRLDRFADALVADTLAFTTEAPHGDRPSGP
ncbi:MotA/TolQ/ExbB proton channel family protein [Hydrogenophaga sp. 2FB]|uniref:MotA/TolQ/ExbB proton channel family protein n=1 Tax=Hydrogenophaga sp. 2FB TaxID=2502187 RepID=UPI00207BBAB6|nr:MotA/TolQ/ExbB proton channel family protein [Hydrogenophaga sp. 2FB]